MLGGMNALKVQTGVYILQNTMARGGKENGAGEKMKNGVVRNKMKKKGKGEKEEKEKGGDWYFLLIYGTHFCW